MLFYRISRIQFHDQLCRSSLDACNSNQCRSAYTLTLLLIYYFYYFYYFYSFYYLLVLSLLHTTVNGEVSPLQRMREMRNRVPRQLDPAGCGSLFFSLHFHSHGPLIVTLLCIMLNLGRRLFLLFSLLSITFADKNLIPTSASDSFPQCGVDCSLLQQAQDSCTAGPEASWTSCFCESAMLTSLKSSGNICTSCTSTTDQSLLSTWYNNYCSSGGGTNNGNGNANSNKGADNAAPSSSISSDAATASSATPSATAASANAHKLSAAEENRSW